jgi:hypothetical protein
MPKEITHWLIADKVAEKITEKITGKHTDKNTEPREQESPRKQDIVRVVREHRHLLYLGAILHDAPYYTPGSQRQEAVRLADRLHGASGEDTFEILYDIVRGIQHNFLLQHTSSNADFTKRLHQLQTFFLGAITHIAADSIFHPCIYYASGNLHTAPHQAWRNHRALESALDLAFCEHFNVSPHQFLLEAYLSQSNQELPHLLDAAPNLALHASAIQNGYRTLARVRRLGTNALLRSCLNGTESLLPMCVQSYTALRYTSAREMSVVAPQTYCHPITGETHVQSFLEMFEDAVQESVRVWGVFERYFDGMTNNNTSIREHGASLEVGLVGVASPRMRFFAEV